MAVPFGFSSGDFMGAALVAYNLWKHCYKVAQHAPQEFKLLVTDINTLSQSLRFLGEENDDPNSTLRRSGEERVRTMNVMLESIRGTLSELQKIAEKYEKLGDLSRGTLKLAWSKFTWSIDASDLDALRNKVIYHNGIIGLLLISCGNSTLQRIEESVATIQKRFSDIVETIQRLGMGRPGISAVDEKASKLTLIKLSAELMKNAEVGQRKWSSIGVDEWIQAGRWWLMKAQAELSEASVGDSTLPRQGYLDLIKASWILVDVIAVHPQLNLLDSGVSSELLMITEIAKNEHETIDTRAHLKPNLIDILDCDFRVWETQSKSPALQVTVHSGLAGAENQFWEATGEDIVYRRFGNYKSKHDAIPTPCIVLVMLHKPNKKARVILGNQSWVVLEAFPVKGILPDLVGGCVTIAERIINFSVCVDARHLCALWEAVGECQLNSDTDQSEPDVLMSFIILVAVKRNFRDVLERVHRDQQRARTPPSPSPTSIAVELRSAAQNLASKYLTDKEEWTPTSVSLFVWAARCDHREVAVVLLHRVGVVVDLEEVLWWYCVHNVASTGNLKALMLFLFEGRLDILGVARKFDLTVLQATAGRGQEAVLDILLKAGADINAGSMGEGGTALEQATRAGHECMVQTLLEAGADANADGGAALRAASKNGQVAIVDKLLRGGADVNNCAPKNECALSGASKAGHAAIVAMLIEAGADVKAGNGAALKAASENGHEAIVDKLLMAGADVNADDGAALSAASLNGQEAIVDKLLKAGADVNAQRGAALSTASERGWKAVVERLLRGGADVNQETTCGTTALSEASRAGHQTIVDRLLEADADVNRGRGAALTVASRNGQESIVVKLLKAGADANADDGAALRVACENGYEAVVDRLLEGGADVNKQNVWVNGALSGASRAGHESIVAKLLGADADPNTKSDDPLVHSGRSGGSTVLVSACYRGQEDIVDKLLAAGANANTQCRSDLQTALQAACIGGHEAIVSKLLKAGSNVSEPIAVVALRLGIPRVVDNPDLLRAMESALIGCHEPVPGIMLQSAEKIGGRCYESIVAANGGYEGLLKLLNDVKAMNHSNSITEKLRRTALGVLRRGV